MRLDETYTWRPPRSYRGGYGTLHDNKGTVWILTRVLTFSPEGFESDLLEPTNRCPHCGRSDWLKPPPQTLEGAIERGWLVQVEP